MNFLLKLIMTTFLCSTILLAQSGGTNKGRPVKLIYYKAPLGAPSDAYIYSQNKEVATVQLTKTYFSKTFQIPRGDVKLSFLEKPLAEDEILSTRAPSVNVPESWTKLIILVFEDKLNPVMPIKLKAINASDNKLGPGSTYIINYTKSALVGEMGDQKINLKGESEIVVKDVVDLKGKKFTSYNTKLDLVVPNEDKPRRFIRQSWVTNNKDRALLFVYPRSGSSKSTYFMSNVVGL